MKQLLLVVSLVSIVIVGVLVSTRDVLEGMGEMMATLVFVVLMVLSPLVAILYKGFAQWVAIGFTFAASFALANEWHLSPTRYFWVCLVLPLLMFPTWKVFIGYHRW